MHDRLFKLSYQDRDELEQAASYLEVAARFSPQQGPAATLFVDSGPDGRSLYTTATGIRMLHELFRVPNGEPISPTALPAEAVHRFGPMNKPQRRS